jgi:hypothetical protein
MSTELKHDIHSLYEEYVNCYQKNEGCLTRIMVINYFLEESSFLGKPEAHQRQT